MRITQEEMEAARAQRAAEAANPDSDAPAPAATPSRGTNWKVLGPVLALCFLLLAGGGALAWRHRVRSQRAAQMARMRGPGGGPRQSMQERMKELGVTAEQQAKMQAVLTEMRPKMEALRGNTSLTDEQRRAQRQALGAEMRTKMEAILTPEQKAKAAQMPGGGFGGFGGRGGRGRGGPGGQGGPGRGGWGGGPGGPPPGGGGGLPDPSKGE
ncbi:MAG: hypothetical protein HZB16_15835 [Armatimonadetes bacterium]|nr:hypothetical protein [Armatimonadota bacterium]